MESEAAGAVPFPWTAIVVGDRSLSCWNRVYEYGDGLLPAQIRSGAVPLLSGPARLAVRVDPHPEPTWSGVEQVWCPASFSVERAAPDVVEFTTRAESRSLAAECRWRFEFDGTTAAFSKAYDEFGAFEARWVGYWETRRPVETDAPGVEVSSYLKPGDGTLTTVANLSRETAQAQLRFDPELLALEDPRILSVVDSREAALDGSRITLGPGGWALLRCGRPPRQAP